MTTWQEGQGTPYDGTYNGNAKMMIGNGTYDFYRPMLLLRAQKGKLVASGENRVEKSMEKIAEWDKEWEAIPLEEREKRRARVISDVTPRIITVNTVKGPMQRVYSTPSDNNNLERQSLKGGRPKHKRLQPPSGSIAAVQFANPLVATPA